MLGSFVLSLALAVAPTDVASRLPLDWSAPAGCPDAAEVRGRIGAYLGRDAFDEAIDEVVVRGRVQRDRRGRWRLTIAVDLPGGTVERAVDAARCDELRDAAALIIAVALDPLRMGRRVEPPAEPAPQPMPEPAVTPPAVVEAAPRPRPRRYFADLRIGGAIELGTAPRIAAGPWLAVALVGRRFRVELAGRYLGPRTVRRFADHERAGVRVQSGIVALRGCFVPRVRRLELPTCAQVEAGAMRGRGVGLAQPQKSQRAMVAAVIGQELAWQLHRHVGLWLAVDAAWALVRPRFAIDDLGTAYTAGPAALRVVAGPSVRL
jgi:hypothetical protein